MFITFEGLDFSGKTTQAQLLVTKLGSRPLPGEQAVRPVRFIREPGGTKISERLREILLDRKNLELHQTTELMLFSASRAQLVAEVIRPALLRGETVVCDRYYDSTTAYQGFGRGLDLEAIDHINTVATGGLVPDLTVFIDIDPEEIGRRQRLAGLSADRMESSGKEFYLRVRQGYLELAKREPHRIVRVAGMAPIQEIEQAVWKILESTVTHIRVK
jgi:dTMP kinase